MNKSYRSIWNAAKQVYVAAAETVSARGKPCSGTKIAARIAVLTGGLLALSANAQTAPPPNALPTGGQVSAGQATISQNGANMVVTQGSDRAAIDWQSFNVGQNAHVQFQQPGASSVALNRVVGPDPSQIFGRITANGQVILTNPAGVYFGPSARVDVGGLIATTHSISNDDFMAGKYKFERNGSEGKVINEGELKAAIEGYVALLAPEVRNQGAIIAQMGTVALAAGETFDLHFDSNNRLTSIRVEPSQIDTLVENRYAVKAPGGLVILSAQSMDRLIGGVVKNSGTIEANGLKEQGGRIILAASNTVENTGIVRADATDGPTLADSGPAGSIEITAPKVVNSGTISANGSKTATAPANRKGGSVKITATEAVVNSGKIEATSAVPVAAVQDAGRIQVQAPRIEQTATGRMDVSGEQQGGTLTLQAIGAVTLSGRLDASAKLDTDTQGGLIDVTTPGPITLLDAQLDTSGGQGGQIQLKAFATETVIEPAQPATPLPLPEDSNSGHLAILGNSSINSRGRSRNGGRVALLGDHIALNDTTRIDVTGATGGGEVLVGGDWQGGNGVYQATTVVMDDGVVIDASATHNGDGGKVVLWSNVHNPDSVTTARGTVFAQGGEYGGNGGKVETSASTINIDTFTVSTAALFGKTGLWLIDPSDYTINDTAARNIETALNDNNVTVTTAVYNASYGANNNSTDPGNITIAAALTSNSANTLELKAANNIYINADITRSSGGLTLRAANNSISGTGKLILGGGTTLSLHKGNVLSNAIELTGDVTVNFASFDLDYLVVGGGGGGGGDAGAGGGGGGMVYGTIDPLSMGILNFNISVGAGGEGGIHEVMNGGTTKDGANGGSSTFSASDPSFTVTALGGGGGKTYPTGSAGGAGGAFAVTGLSSGFTGKNGGAGGAADTFPDPFNFNSSSQGAVGANGPTSGIPFCTVAACANDDYPNIPYTGNPGVYGGGGGGGVIYVEYDQQGLGGKGGGGLGGIYSSSNATQRNGGNGTTNSGGGGGGGSGGENGTFGIGGAGGSGVVKLRYFGKSDIATGGTEADGVLGVAGYRVHTFTDPAQAYTFSIDQAQLVVTLNGNISGTGNLKLNATGGTVSLGGSSTYTGATEILGGTVKTTSSSALGNSIVTIANAANTTLDISGSSLAIGGLSGGGATGGNVVLGDKTLTTGNATDTNFNGLISGTGGLAKQGAGTFTLTANQTYTGATVITAGTLVLQNNAPTKATSGFSGAGTLRIEPTGASFNSAFSTSGWTFGTDLGGLTLGKSGNLSNMTVPDALSVSGPVRIYGGDLSLGGGITTSGDMTTVAAGLTNFGPTSVGGMLSSTTRGAGASGGVKQTGAMTVTGTSTFIADTGTNQVAVLENAANNFGGAVSFTNANNGSWNSVSIKDTNALTLGSVTTTGNLTTEAGGSTSYGATTVGGMLSSTTRGAGALGGVTQTGAITVAGTSTFIADTGTDQEALLTNAANDFGGSVSFTNANNGAWKNASIKDTNALTLGNVTTTGNLTTDAGGSTSYGATNVGGMLSSTTRGAGALGGVTQTGAIIVAGTSSFIADPGTDQAAVLTNAANDFMGAVSFTSANNGAWKNVSIKDTNTLTLGNVTTTGNLTTDAGGSTSYGATTVGGMLSSTTRGTGALGGVTQTGVLSVTGTSTFIADTGTDQESLLTNSANDFVGAVSFTNANNGSWKSVSIKDTNGLTLGDITTRKDQNGDGGALTVDGGTGDITQDTTGDKNIVVDGDTTLRTDGDITLNGPTNDFKGIVNGDGSNITLKDTNGLTLGDITTRKDPINGDGGALTVDGGTGDITQDTTGDKNIVVDGDTTLRADGDITLNGPTNDFKGIVNGDGKNITLKDTNGLTLGDITTRKDQNGNGGTLTVDGGTGDITQDTTGDKNIVVDGDTTLRADGQIKLDGATNDFKGSVNGDGKNITLKDTNGLTLGDITTRKDLNGDGGTLTVDGGTGDITQDTTGGKNTVVDGDTTLRTDGDITLNGPTNDFKGIVNGDGSNITLKDTNGLTLGDITTRKDPINGDGGALTVDGGTGDITQDTTGDKNIVVDGDTTLRTDGDITLNGPTNDFKGIVNGDGSNITLKDTNGLTLGDITTRKDPINGDGGALTVDGGTGDITQDTTGDKNIVVDGDTTLRADGDITLNGPTNDFKGIVNGDGKNITLKDTNGLTLGDITTRKDQNGDGGTLTVDGGTGDITQDTTGGKNTVVDGDTTLRADGDITLDGTTNDFKGIVNVIGADDVKLNDTNDLVLGNVDIIGKLDATAEKDLSLDGTIRSRSLDLEATKGDITQGDDSQLTVTNGPTDLKAGDDITLKNPKNDFNGSVNAGDDISLTDSNSLTLGNVNTTGNLTLNTTGLLDLGTSRINGKLDAITNNGNIIQAGPLYVGGDTDLNAGTGRVTLTNTGNDLRGRINVIASFYDIAGGAGNNAGKLQERVLGTLPVTPSPGLPGSRFGTSTPPEPLTLNGATSSTGTMAFTDGANGTGIVVKQEPTPATDGAIIVTVSVPTESAKPGSTFKFQLPESVRDLTQGGAEPQVALINGGPIPSWLTFDVETMTFVAAEVPAGGIPIDVAVVIGDQRVIVAVSENAEA